MSDSDDDSLPEIEIEVKFILNIVCNIVLFLREFAQFVLSHVFLTVRVSFVAMCSIPSAYISGFC